MPPVLVPVYHPPSTNAPDTLCQNGGLLRELETRFGGLICHQDAINAVSYSPDGRRLASASSDGTVKLWDPSAGKQVKNIDCYMFPCCCSSCSSGGGGDGAVEKYSTKVPKIDQTSRGNILPPPSEI